VCVDWVSLTLCLISVVFTEKLVLWRSEIFGGISNEISVLLDDSTLLRDMKGFAFGRRSQFCLTEIFVSQPKATWTGGRRTPRPSCA